MKGTDEYKKFALEFKFSASQARDMVIRHVNKKLGFPEDRPLVKELWDENHHFIIGQEYVFNTHRSKTGIPLSGYYVDGNTGVVREVTVLDEVSF